MTNGQSAGTAEYTASLQRGKTSASPNVLNMTLNNVMVKLQ